MPEVRKKASVTPDDRLQGPSFTYREVVLGAASRTGEMDVLALSSPMVLGSLFEVGVLHDPQLLEHDQRPIHSGHVHGRHPPLDPASNHLRRDVSLSPHHLAKDRFTLRGQTSSFPPKLRHDFLDTLHRSSKLLQWRCTCNEAETARQETLISWTPQACRPVGFATLSKVSLF